MFSSSTLNRKTEDVEDYDDQGKPKKRRRKVNISKGQRECVSFNRMLNSIPQEDYNPVILKKELFQEGP